MRGHGWLLSNISECLDADFTGDEIVESCAIPRQKVRSGALHLTPVWHPCRHRSPWVPSAFGAPSPVDSQGHALSACGVILQWRLRIVRLRSAWRTQDGNGDGSHRPVSLWPVPPCVPSIAGSTPHARRDILHKPWSPTARPWPGNLGSCAPVRSSRMLLLSCTGFLCGHTLDN